LARTVAVAVELLGELRQVMRTHAGIGEEAERVAQGMRDKRQADHRAQRRLSPWRQRFVDDCKLDRNQRGGLKQHGSELALPAPSVRARASGHPVLIILLSSG